MAALVSLSNVVKEYPLGKLVVQALRGVSVDVGAGEFLAVAGPSGSGKTTLLNMVGCVDVPTSGTVAIDGTDVAAIGERKRTDLRLHTLGFIFQSFNLVPVLDAARNVELPLLLQGKLSGKERRARVDEMLAGVGLRDQAKQRPNELSGGQRQRVAIARALVSRPRIVLADEPTANLDSATGSAIIDLMQELNRTRQTTFIFSTHDPRVTSKARRLIELVDGRIVRDEAATPAAQSA